MCLSPKQREAKPRFPHAYRCQLSSGVGILEPRTNGYPTACSLQLFPELEKGVAFSLPPCLTVGLPLVLLFLRGRVHAVFAVAVRIPWSLDKKYVAKHLSLTGTAPRCLHDPCPRMIASSPWHTCFSFFFLLFQPVYCAALSIGIVPTVLSASKVTYGTHAQTDMI